MTAKGEWQWILQALNAAQNLAKQLTSIVNKNQIVHAPGGRLRQCIEGGKILYNKHCRAVKLNNLPTSGYLFFWDFSLSLAAHCYQKQYSFQEITAERRIQPCRGVYKMRLDCERANQKNTHKKPLEKNVNTSQGLRRSTEFERKERLPLSSTDLSIRNMSAVLRH